MKITKRILDKMAQDSTLWDSELRGFGARRRSRGINFVLKYRMSGQQRWYTIGKFGSPWTVETARAKAKMLLGAIADGQDPALVRDDKKARPTVKDLWDRYLEEHVRPTKKPKTVKNDESQFKNWIEPHLGHRFVSDVNISDVNALKTAVKGGKRPTCTVSGASLPQHIDGGQTAANRVLALLSNMLTFAERNGLRQQGDNPCRLVPKFKEEKRKRYLTEDELGTLLKVLSREEVKLLLPSPEADDDPTRMSPYAIAAIRLLLFTGARLNEILTLKWEYLDLDRRIAQLPDSKTGAKVIMLTDPAIRVLENLPRLNSNPYVICGQKQGSHLVNLQKPWRAVRRKAGIEDVRIHDMRHTFASILASRGQSLPIIGGLLGHSQASTTQRYAHLQDDPLRAAAGEVASAFSEIEARSADQNPKPEERETT